MGEQWSFPNSRFAPRRVCIAILKSGYTASGHDRDSNENVFPPFFFPGRIHRGGGENGVDRGGQEWSRRCCRLGQNGFPLSGAEILGPNHLHHEGLSSREYSLLYYSIIKNMKFPGTVLDKLGDKSVWMERG